MTIIERKLGATLATEVEIERRPYVFKCDTEGCYYRVSVVSPEAAEHQRITHGCPRKGADMPLGKSILEKAWDQLDDAVEKINDPNTPAHDLDRIKFAARGKAEVIALFMVPHFKTADDVSREAMRRYRARKQGEDPITPGIGLGRMVMPEESRMAPRKAEAPIPAKKKAVNLKPEDVEGIKSALAGGIPVDVLASMFNVSISDVRSLMN